MFIVADLKLLEQAVSQRKVGVTHGSSSLSKTQNSADEALLTDDDVGGANSNTAVSALPQHQKLLSLVEKSFYNQNTAARQRSAVSSIQPERSRATRKQGLKSEKKDPGGNVSNVTLLITVICFCYT
jgi:hypothetical protein